jgi:hypothetical protein
MCMSLCVLRILAGSMTPPVTEGAAGTWACLPCCRQAGRTPSPFTLRQVCEGRACRREVGFEPVKVSDRLAPPCRSAYLPAYLDKAARKSWKMSNARANVLWWESRSLAWRDISSIGIYDIGSLGVGYATKYTIDKNGYHWCIERPCSDH